MADQQRYELEQDEVDVVVAGWRCSAQLDADRVQEDVARAVQARRAAAVPA